ncbi:hypothetical protein ACGFYQ_36960 [Streptomyces sp. NPDC048258]|uniref:hypothetical protein n=1 Tax=Streptomyces sp. NPDC048258 TaxID=3365527 RepID=UPI0037185432
MTAPDEQQIATYGTGLQTTRITRRSDGTIRWQHSRGHNHTTPYPPVPDDFTARARDASDDRLHFATPTEADATRSTWNTAGRRSAARFLLIEDDPGHHLYDLLGRLGARLEVLHTPRPAPPRDVYPPPPGPARLRTWLEHGRGTRAGAGFHYRLRSQLGPGRFAKLRAYTDTVLQPTDHDTVLHGWLTLGSIVPPDEPGSGLPTAVLSGIEAAYGRPEADLSSIVGEIEEFRRTAELSGTPRPFLRRLTATFLDHYGLGYDRSVVAAGAVVRIATHAHDFANYVGWHASLHTYVPMLADLLDCDGNTALPGT